MARRWKPATEAAFERQLEAARREGRGADAVEPHAETVTYDSDRQIVLVELKGGHYFGFHPSRVPGLHGASAREISAATISPGGDGIHWPELDAHASLTRLVIDAFSLQRWAPRLLGQRTNPRRAAASRANGRLGGRPRKNDGDRSDLRAFLHGVPGIGRVRADAIAEEFSRIDQLAAARPEDLARSGHIPRPLAERVVSAAARAPRAGQEARTSSRARSRAVARSNRAAPTPGRATRVTAKKSA